MLNKLLFFTFLVGLLSSGVVQATPQIAVESPALTGLNRGRLVGYGNNFMEVLSPPANLGDVVDVRSLGLMAVALRRDGTVVSWGSFATGNPELLSNVQQIAGGYSSFGALLADSTVRVVGFGMAEPPQGLTGVTAIAAGFNHMLALKSDQTVVAWGSNSSGSVVVPPGLTDVVKVAATRNLSAAIKSNGELVLWGELPAGLLPLPAQAQSGVVDVAFNDRVAAVVKSDGSVFMWGGQPLGELTPPSDLTGVAEIHLGSNHAVALLSNGRVRAWSSNGNEQIAFSNEFGGVKAISCVDNVTLMIYEGLEYGNQVSLVDSAPQTVVIRNTGSTTLTLSNVSLAQGPEANFLTDFLSFGTSIEPGETTQFTVRFRPLSAGFKDGRLVIASNAANQPTLEYGLVGRGGIPVLSVRVWLGPDLVRGDDTPTVEKRTDYGPVEVSRSMNMEIVARNDGTLPLEFSADPTVQIDGPHASDFRVRTPFPREIRPGGFTVLGEVEFTPSAEGLRQAVISLPSNDPAGTFSFTVQGTGTPQRPRLVLLGDSGDGALSRIAAGGSTRVGFLPGQNLQQTFTISNERTIALTGLSVALTGADAAQFSFSQPLVTTLGQDQSTTFTLTCLATNAGPFQAQLEISSNDPDHQPFRAQLSTTDQVRLQFPSDADFSSYGDRLSVTPNVELDFVTNFFKWDTNYGDLIDVVYTANSPARLRLAADPGHAVRLHGFDLAGYVAARALRSLRVIDETTGRVLFSQLNFSVPGTVEAGHLSFDFANALTANRLLIEYETENEGIDNIGLDNLVFSQETLNASLELRFGRVRVDDGSMEPTEIKGTHFGAVSPRGGQSVRSFQIHAGGPSLLILNGICPVTVTGPDAEDFYVALHPLSPIAVRRSSSLQVVFAPKSAGEKNASLVIGSNAVNRPTVTVPLRGFAGLNPMRSTTIVFHPPAVHFLGSGPILLNAYASSGAPVVYAVEGDADLVGQLLTANAPGVLRVTAMVGGQGPFRSGAEVRRTIQVRAAPTALTLVNLVKTYNGTPQAVDFLPASSTATVSYRVAGVDSATPPTAAGRYPVRVVDGGITRSGVFEIKKALLTVTPRAASRAAGQNNPPFEMDITGYLAADDETAISRLPALSSSAKPSSPVGTYAIQAQGGLAANYEFRYLPGELTVTGFPGRYEVLLKDLTEKVQGKVDFTLSSTGAAFTARAELASTAGILSLRGGAVAGAIAGAYRGSAAAQLNGVAWELRVEINPQGQGEAILLADSTPLLSGVMEKVLVLPKGVLAAWRGKHTVVLEAQDGSVSNPLGTGWATGTIGANGTLRLVGQLGDATPLTASLQPYEGSPTRYGLFLRPFRPARLDSMVTGLLSTVEHPTLTNRRVMVGQSVLNQKQARAADATYPNGYADVESELFMDPWIPPTRSSSLGSLLRLTNQSQSFDVRHSPTNTNSDNVFPSQLRLASGNRIVVLQDPENQTNWNARINPSTGTWSGSFRLFNAQRPTITPITGVMRQTQMGDDVIGGGLFLLPSMTADETPTTGEVLFER